MDLEEDLRKIEDNDVVKINGALRLVGMVNQFSQNRDTFISMEEILRRKSEIECIWEVNED
jgi:hypothetical protein